MTDIAQIRGKEEEELVRQNLEAIGRSSQKVFFVSNESVYLPTTEKRLTEIDSLFISESGILVVECKHMTGSVIGKANDRLWTKTGDNHVISFPNPILQNRKHAEAVAAYFHVPLETCKSVIIFNDSCDFSGVSTGMGAILLKTGDMKSILPQILTKTVFSAQELDTLINSAKKLPSGTKEEDRHLAEIREEKQRRRSEKKRGR